MSVLRGRDASMLLEATIVYAQQDMTETGKIKEQDAVQNPLPKQGKTSY
jgi:hypothetical protein